MNTSNNTSSKSPVAAITEPSDQSLELRAAQRPASWRLVLALVLVAAIFYGQGLTHSAGNAGDSFHHLINGIFVLDALRNPVESLSDPIGFGYNYYLHYPAVNLGYYPPVFAVLEATLMSVLGVSATTGQLAVFLMVILLTLFTFAWFRLRFDPWWAAAATLLVILTPNLVFWGRDIMLEIPALAFIMGSIWSFERLLRSDKPTWTTALTWALLTALALWTKQHAMMLLGIFVISTVAARRWRHLLAPPVLVSTIIVAVAAAALFKLQLALGGDAVKHSIGLTAAERIERLNLEQWIFYLKALPDIVGWPTLAIAPLGLLWIFKRRESYVSPIVAWLLVFYVMHSFFVAQTERYGVLWVPPFCACAIIGLRHLVPRRSHSKRWAAVAGALPVALVGLAIYQAAAVENRRVPTAYQRVAEDLADRLAPFSCVSFLSDRPGRPAVCYRLAVARRLTEQRDIYSFGRMLRANQLLRAYDGQWQTHAEDDERLKQWNVKYILTETSRLSHPLYGEEDHEVAAFIDGILALGHFRELRKYPIKWAHGRVRDRSLVLYERIEPMTFHPGSVPEIRTERIRRTITRGEASHEHGSHGDQTTSSVSYLDDPAQ